MHGRARTSLLRKRLLILLAMFAGTLTAYAVTGPFLEPVDVATERGVLAGVVAIQLVVFFFYRNRLLRHRTNRSLLRAYVLSLIGALIIVLIFLTALSGGFAVVSQ
jgi:hypothetical protein